jgi:hypothetical protein
MEKYRTEIKWGIIFTAVMLLWMVFERMMGWHGERIDQHAIMTSIFAIFAIAIYVFALRDKRKNDLGGLMSWKKGFQSGLIITLVVVLLSPLTQWIIHTVISPDFFQNMVEYSVESGMMERQEAEAYFNLRSYLVQSAVGALGLGVVTSAVVAVFTKK